MLAIKVLLIVSTITNGTPNTQVKEMPSTAVCLAMVKHLLETLPKPDKDHQYGVGCIVSADTDA